MSLESTLTQSSVFSACFMTFCSHHGLSGRGFVRGPSKHRSASSQLSRRCQFRVVLGRGRSSGDEDVEWGALPPPSGQADDRVSVREGDHDRPRVRRLHLINSQSVAPDHLHRKGLATDSLQSHTFQNQFGRTWCTSARRPVIPRSTRSGTIICRNSCRQWSSSAGEPDSVSGFRCTT